METILASDLCRNDGVVIERDELPHLVDFVRSLPNGAVSVQYSSGDVIEYPAGITVTVVE